MYSVLGVHPNALYSHVQSKAALVDALLDDARAAVRLHGFATPPPLETPRGATPGRAELGANFRRGLDWLLAGITGPGA